MADISKLKPNGATGTEYNIIDDDYRNTDHTFTMNTYSSYSHTFEDTQISQRMPVRNVFTGIQSLFNSVKTAINDHGSLFGDIATALAFRVTKDNATYKALNFHSYDHTIDDSMELTTQFDGAGEMGCVWFTNTNLGVVTDAVNDHAEWIAKETAGSKTVTGNPLTITDAAGIKAEKIVIEFEPKQAGSGTPSPSNIRPITGYTSLSADGCGENLLENANIDTTYTSSIATALSNYKNTKKFAVGYIGSGNTISNNNSYEVSFTRCFAGKTYTIKLQENNTFPSVLFIDDDGNIISRSASWSISTYTHTAASNEKYIVCSFLTTEHVQIEENDQATTYEPFKGDSILVQFGQTLYGGKLTILQDGSADVDVDTGYFDNDPNDYEYNSTAKVFVIKKSIPNVTVVNQVAQDAISNAFTFYPAITVYTQNDITGICFDQSNNCYFRIQGYTTQAEYTTFLANNPMQVAYKLATPFTIHLSPVETLTLLQGINNVWTDGTTLSLTYQPDNAIGQAKIYANETAEIVAKEYTTETDTTDTDIYLYRASQNNGDRCYLRQLVGASFGVNQLVQNGDFASASGWGTSGATFSASNNIANITATAKYGQIYKWIPVITNHKYLIRANIKGKTSNYVEFTTSFRRFVTTAGSWQQLSFIASFNVSENKAIVIGDNADSGWTQFNAKDATIIDLTQMFDTAIADKAYTMEQTTAGSGIAWLKSYGFFTESYYPYSTGSLQSVNTSGKVNTEKNLFDEQKYSDISLWHRVTYSSMQGFFIYAELPSNFPKKFRATSFLKTNSLSWFVMGFSTSINFTSGSDVQRFVQGGVNTNTDFDFSNADKVYLIIGDSTGNINPSTSPISVFNAYNILFTLENKDISVYEPYTTHTTTISPIDLRGVPKLVDNNIVYDGDVRDESGRIDRKYLEPINMGSLNWTNWGNNLFVSDVISNAKIPSSGYNTNVVCAKYPVGNTDKTIRGIGTSGSIAIQDSSYTDATTFKTAMNGVYLTAERATPTTEQTTPIQNPEIYNQFGWEKFIDDRSYPIPVGYNSEYVNLPDWMETGYVDDLRKRVDETIINKLDDSLIGNYSRNLVEDKLEGYNIDSIGRISYDASFDMQIAKIKQGEIYTVTTNDNLVAGFFVTKPTTTSQSYDNTRVVDTQSKTFIAPIDGYIAFRTQAGYTTPQCELGTQSTYYEPYIPTNAELYEMIKALQS